MIVFGGLATPLWGAPHNATHKESSDIVVPANIVSTTKRRSIDYTESGTYMKTLLCMAIIGSKVHA